MNVLPPSAVGVPEITPVLASRLKPSGREPLVTLHVIGAVPSAKRVVLYAASAVPFGRLVVVIVGVYFHTIAQTVLYPFVQYAAIHDHIVAIGVQVCPIIQYQALTLANDQILL